MVVGTYVVVRTVVVLLGVGVHGGGVGFLDGMHVS